MLINLTAKVAKGLRKGRNTKLCELNKANCNREKKILCALCGKINHKQEIRKVLHTQLCELNKGNYKHNEKNT